MAPASPTPPLPFVPEFLVQSTFGSVVRARADEYLDDESIRSVEWIVAGSGRKGELVGRVHGSASAPYRTRVSLAQLGESLGTFRRELDAAAGSGPVGVTGGAGLDGKGADDWELTGPGAPFGTPSDEEYSAFDQPQVGDDLPIWMPSQSTCSCPVGINCKHGAALALHSGRQALAWARAGAAADGAWEPTPRREASWQRILAPFLAEEPEEAPEQVQLALGFELMAEQLERTRFSWGNEPLTRAHLEAGKNVFLSVRPLARGKRGTWIKGGLSWRTFEYRMPGRGYDPAHADALTRIFALAESERSHTQGTVEQLWVNTFRTPLVWESLARARDAGVAFVGLGTVNEVRLGERAEVLLDVREAGSGLVLDAAATIDGERVPGARALGVCGLARIDEAQGRTPTFDLLMAPTAAPMPQHVQSLLTRPEPVRIPAADRDDFLTQAVPLVTRALPVASVDGSVEIPEPEPARLRLEARYAGANALTLTWQFEYPSTGRRFSVHSRAGAGRDGQREDHLLAEVRALWPTAGGAAPGGAIAEGTERLTDVDTALFTSSVLPALEAHDGVHVAVRGTRHEYRELDASPHVRVTQTENSAKNDWFDLGFTITIDGRTIPFATLFTALAQGKSRLLLEDRTYFSLDHEAFDALRALIAEGEALAEWEPEHQQVSKYQAGFFEDLVDAADEVEVAAEWAQTVGKLKDLRELPEPALPGGLMADLRPYQVQGFAYLAFLHSMGLGGILADDMGLGKTLQTLALIQHAVEGASDSPRRPFLVVAPSSVLSVWESEAATFTPELNVRVLERTRRARGTSVHEEIQGADIVVTSYTIVRIDSEEFAREQFAGLILDEAQFVKNRSSRVHQCVKRIKAPFRLAITGTPMENSLADLWSLMSLTAPGVLGSAVQFREQYTHPIESGEHPEKMAVLRRRVRPFLLRRTKEVVAADLPEKQEQVLHIELTDAHRSLYDSVLQRERKKVLGLLDDMDKNRFIVFRSLTLLRMLALDPAIVDEGQHAHVASSKLDAMFARLDEIVAEGHRVLVFSQFTSFLARIADGVEERGLRYSYLDGSTRNRPEVIREFREGDAPVFLISLKAGGFGLTLTEADYVFLMDPWWNPAAENQAIDRAHRIGQSERVMVYRLVATDTIEEKVLALQEKKAALFSSLTDGGSAFSEALSVEDVRSLLA
ncbi:MAG: DEAD/DEAH box helicase [Dermabacter sp.]|nr:DEAD/DEAH box helicase [Dermabacter sp.]